MSMLVIERAVVHFEPDAGWRWSGFDGRVEPVASIHRLEELGQFGIVDDDLIALEHCLIGRQYVAEGIDQVPGTIVRATVVIDQSTLSERVVIQGRHAATSETKGTFSIAFVPSTIPGPPLIADKAPIRTGTWTVETPASSRTLC